MLPSSKSNINYFRTQDASGDKFGLILWRLDSLTALHPPPQCLNGLMDIVKLLEISLIVILACVSKGTWYLVCFSIMIL